MTAVRRTLDEKPVQSLEDHVAAGGGLGLDAARRLGRAATIDDVDASGLRGRGGAGFPTGRKWRTVAENASPVVPTTVVVNGAEGEPGSFKDRALLRANPYRVLEGALVAAHAVAADRVLVALKASFEVETERVRRAIDELRSAGWTEGVELDVVLGPSEYLFGEETALLEVADGRAPFPRIAPPYRQGVDEIGPDTASAAGAALAGPGDATVAPPALANNVETLANVPGILANGPSWFRSVGTDQSPGTIVCTVTGRTKRHGVGEFAMGTPLAEIIEQIGGGASPGDEIVAVVSGVANALLPATLLDTPTTYEAMREAGSGLGAAGFIVFDDETDLVAVAHAVSRFLAVESCGQCTPCKQDGLTITGLLDGLRRSQPAEEDVERLGELLATVTDESRCYLAQQHQLVVESVLRLFPDVVRNHASGAVPAAEVELVAPILDIVEERAVLDERHLAKQPDWTFDADYSGQSPADRLDQRQEPTESSAPR